MLYSIINGFEYIDYDDDESSNTIIQLCIQCCDKYSFINQLQGRKCIAYILSLHYKNVIRIHTQLKLLIISSRASAWTHYADIYIRAWKLAQGQIRLTIGIGKFICLYIIYMYLDIHIDINIYIQIYLYIYIFIYVYKYIYK
jgi:hypothetical protein